jgi:hypothetical protein
MLSNGTKKLVNLGMEKTMSLESKSVTLRDLQLVEGFDIAYDKERLIKEGATGLAEILDNKWVLLEEAQKLEAKIMEFRKILGALEVEMRPKNYNLAYLRLREALK